MRDTTAGFVCYRANIYGRFLDRSFIGYAFRIEMKYRVKMAGFRIAGAHRSRTGEGKSKMSANIFHEASSLMMRTTIKEAQNCDRP